MNFTNGLLNANNNLLSEVIKVLGDNSTPQSSEIYDYLSEPFSKCGYPKYQPVELERILKFRKIMVQLIDIQKELGDIIDDMVSEQYMGIK
jgi:hypothetical protein